MPPRTSPTITPKPPPKARTRSKIPADLGRTPVRTCVGCGAKRPQAELVRIARTAEGTLVQSRTLPGRGAWLCSGAPDCLELAIRRGGFARSFRSSVSTATMAELRSAMAADQQR